MLRWELEAQVLVGCRRLADKGFLNHSSDSLSVRIPGTTEMLMTTTLESWRDVEGAAICTKSFISEEAVAGLHGSIYLERPDVGAAVLSSPRGVRLLAMSGDVLPPLFDEQVRHIGLAVGSALDEGNVSRERIRKAFQRGNNAALLGERLICLGMTCERALFNTELFEKCAQAYAIAKASGIRAGVIPAWVRLIANHRLMRDERKAAASYLSGRIPDDISGY
jgi:ribulose-5-phosphate 4-epimerase/fuculose-1-phosphate aldolase